MTASTTTQPATTPTSTTTTASGANAPAPLATTNHLTVGQLRSLINDANVVMGGCLAFDFSGQRGPSAKAFALAYNAFKTALPSDPNTQYQTPFRNLNLTNGLRVISLRAMAEQVIGVCDSGNDSGNVWAQELRNELAGQPTQ